MRNHRHRVDHYQRASNDHYVSQHPKSRIKARGTCTKCNGRGTCAECSGKYSTNPTWKPPLHGYHFENDGNEAQGRDAALSNKSVQVGFKVLL